MKMQHGFKPPVTHVRTPGMQPLLGWDDPIPTASLSLSAFHRCSSVCIGGQKLFIFFYVLCGEPRFAEFWVELPSLVKQENHGPPGLEWSTSLEAPCPSSASPIAPA